MARQIDYIGVGLIIRRTIDGTYTYSLENAQTFVSDPSQPLAIDRGPWMLEGLNGVVYDGIKTVDAFLLELLQASAAGVGLPLYTDRVINKTTKQYLISVNGAGYDSAWIMNPDMTAVQGVPAKYWKINGDDTVSVMDQSEKDAVDAAALPGNILAQIGQMKLAVTTYIAQHYDPAQQITLLSLWSEALTNTWPNRIALIQSVMAWVDSVLTYFYGKIAEIQACTTQSALDAVTYDFSTFSATDPHVSLGTLRATQN
jgi:hypothetical protein